MPDELQVAAARDRVGTERPDLADDVGLAEDLGPVGYGPGPRLTLLRVGAPRGPPGTPATWDRRTPPRGHPPIPLDINPEELGHQYRNDGSLLGDAKVTLARMIELADGDPPAGRGTWTARTATLVQQYLKTVRASSPKVRVIANDPVTVVGATGQRLYIERPAGATGQAVTGWLVLATSDYDFLVFSLATTAQDFVRLRPVFDASFATIRIRQQDEVQAIRMARLARGRTIINSFTPDKLRSVIGRIGRKAVYRIYTPSASGRRLDDTEIGYLTIEGREGMRGELNANRARSAYTDMEAEVGLLVLIEARGLGGDQSNHFLDVQSRFWMAWDRSKEAWSTLRTERLGNRVLNTTGETGVRDFGLLNVIISAKERMSREPKQWSLPDRACLRQHAGCVLRRLLPRAVSVGAGWCVAG